MNSKVLVALSLFLLALLWITTSGLRNGPSHNEIVSEMRTAIRQAGFEKVRVSRDGAGTVVLSGSVASEKEAADLEALVLRREEITQVDRDNLTWWDTRPAPYIGLVFLDNSLVVTGQVNNHQVKARILEDFRQSFGAAILIEDQVEVSRAIDNPLTFYAPAEGARSLDFFNPDGAVAAIRNDANWSGGPASESDSALVAALAGSVNSDRAAQALIDALRSRQSQRDTAVRLNETTSSLAALEVAKKESDRIRSEAEDAAAAALTEARKSAAERDRALGEAQQANRKKEEAIRTARLASSTAEKAAAAESEAKARAEAAEKERAAAATARIAADKALAATRAKNQQLADLTQRLEKTRKSLVTSLSARTEETRSLAEQIRTLTGKESAARQAAAKAQENAVTTLARANQLEIDLKQAGNQFTKQLAAAETALARARTEATSSARQALAINRTQATANRQLAAAKTALEAADKQRTQAIEKEKALQQQVEKLVAQSAAPAARIKELESALATATRGAKDASRQRDEALAARDAATAGRDVASKAVAEARAAADEAERGRQAAFAARQKLENDLRAALTKQLESTRSAEETARIIATQQAAAAQAGTARQTAEMALAEAQEKLAQQAEVGAQLKSLQDRQHKLTEELSKARNLAAQEKKTKEEALAAAQQAADALVAAKAAHKKSATGLREEIATRQGTIDQLTGQITQLETELARKPKGPSPESLAALAKLKQDRELALSQLRRAEASRNDTARKNEALKTALAESEVSEAALAQIVGQLEASRASLAQLDARNKTSQTALEKALAELATSSKDKDQLAARNQSLETQLAELAGQQQAAETELAAARAESAKLQQLADAKARAAAESDSKLAELKRQLDASTTKGSQAETRKQELEAHVARLESEKKKGSAEDAAKLQTALGQNETLRKELAGLREQLDESETRIAGLVKTLANSNQALTDLTKRAEGTSSRVAELEKAAEKSAADAFREAELGLRAQAAAQAADEKAANATRQLEATVAREQAATRERDEAIARLKELEVARGEAESTGKKAVEERDAARSDLEASRKALTELEKIRQVDTAAAKTAAEETSRLIEQSRKLMADIDARNAQIAEAVGLKEKVENASRETLEKLKSAEETLGKLRGENQNLTASKEKLETSLTQNIAELRKLREQFEALRQNNSQIKGHAEDLKQRIIRMDPIRYNRNSANVSEQQQRVLAQVTEILEIFPQARFEIVGHTCDIGSREGNLRLSLQRAENLATFLVENGIDESKLTTRGVADDDPLAPNDSEKNRRQNRRVVILFQDQP